MESQNAGPLQQPGLRARLRARLQRVERTLALAAALAIVAALTQWLVWLRGESAREDAFTGPPRSDYTLSEFSLSALGDDGTLAFAVDAPRLVKHPWLDTLSVEAPRFRLFDARRNEWHARSKTGWVRADGKQLRLEGAVDARRLPSELTTEVSLASERLDAFIDESRLASDLAVTIAQAGSILRGVGLDADLANDRIVIDRQVEARYDPKLKP